MYFFYIDETGSRDPRATQEKTDGSIKTLDPIYVLTAVALFERNWPDFDRDIANLKLELADHLFKTLGMKLTLADCEVKSITLRNPKERESKSPFLHHLGNPDRLRISQLFYEQLARRKMTIFSVVIDKRELHSYMTYETMHKKAYEILLERIEHFLWKEHPSQRGLIVMDDTQRELNRAVAMKHAYFQREGNRHLQFKHILEYPFFTDSRLSNGVQLADLCSYNVYRAFRAQSFEYPFFARMLPHFYSSSITAMNKLDGLKVWPETSPWVSFASAAYSQFLKNPDAAKT